MNTPVLLETERREYDAFYVAEEATTRTKSSNITRHIVAVNIQETAGAARRPFRFDADIGSDDPEDTKTTSPRLSARFIFNQIDHVELPVLQRLGSEIHKLPYKSIYAPLLMEIEQA